MLIYLSTLHACQKLPPSAGPRPHQTEYSSRVCHSTTGKKRRPWMYVGRTLHRGEESTLWRRRQPSKEALRRVACPPGTRGQYVRWIGTATRDGRSIPSVPFLAPQNRKLNEFVAERNRKHCVIAIPPEITRRSARARYVRPAYKNSKLGHDLDAIVKSLALNSCKDNSSSAPKVPFLLKTKRIADSHAHVRRWARSCFPS